MREEDNATDEATSILANLPAAVKVHSSPSNLVEDSEDINEKEEDNAIDEVTNILTNVPAKVKSHHLPSNSVEESEDINEIKDPVMSMIQSAQNFLQRSLAVMVTSVMSKLYGTKEILQQLYQVSLLMQKLPKESKQRISMQNMLDATMKEHCKLQTMDCIEPEKEWLWKCRQFLPHKTKDPQKEWECLSEDLKSWKLDTSLKLIRHATHNGDKLFESKYICLKTNASNNYNFLSLNKKATDLQNFYAHSPDTLQVTQECEQHFEVIENFAQAILEWVENEIGDSNDITICKESLQQIQIKRKEFFKRNISSWEDILRGVEYFNFNDFGYVLVSTPCNARAGVTILNEVLAQLSIVPWAAVVDFDARSKEDGLLHAFKKPGSDQLKDTCWISGKRIMHTYSFDNIQYATQQRTPCRIPWIFPHGEHHNQTDQGCPLNNHKEYKARVRTPLNDSVRDLAGSISDTKSGGALSVILCYGHYANKHENKPYEEFLDDLNYFCCNLEDRGNVIILTDQLFLKYYLKSLPVHIFPLDKFCEKIYSCLSIVECNLPPITMPSFHGLEEKVDIIEEDFKLVHKHVDKYEIHQYQMQKLSANSLHKTTGECKITERHKIYDEVRDRFYKGEAVTWISLKQGHAIDRAVESEITPKIEKLLGKHKAEPTKCILYHSSGAGASTLARKILWELKAKYPCVILNSDYKLSDERGQQTIEKLKFLYTVLQKPILMLVDEEPFFNTVATLTHHAQTHCIPMVFFHVQRLDTNNKFMSKKELKRQGYKDIFYLKDALCEEDIKNLQDKLFSAYKTTTDQDINIMESSIMGDPKIGDKVTDFTRDGIITTVEPINTPMMSYFLVNVQWCNNSKKELCYTSNYHCNISSRRVYLKKKPKEILHNIYKTFQFYGLMCLDKDYHPYMHEHIAACLKSVSADDLKILANISLLFAYKVCESIHVKAFENLCYGMTKRVKVDNLLQLDTEFLPKAALEFILVTYEGYFRIVHPFVAKEIVDYYLLKHKVSASKFLCNFLDYMLPEKKSHAQSILAVNRLLYNREYSTSDDDNTIKRQPFSSLILEHEEQAETILEHGTHKLKTCHSYGHYARYLSKKVQKFDEALDQLKLAHGCASQPSEEALVYNIEGDIHRDRLEHYLEQHDTLNWKSTDNKAYEYHWYACQAYHYSRQRNSMVDHPLFGELSVRLKLLEEMKKKSSKSDLFTLLGNSDDLEIINSIDTCHYLIEKLNDFVKSGEGGKDAESYDFFVKMQQQRLYAIVGSIEDQKRSIWKLVEVSPDCETKAYNKRSFVSLCVHNPTEYLDWNHLRSLTEENFKYLGYNDRDMQNWLMIIKNIPPVAKNIQAIEKQLLSWKDGPHVLSTKKKVQSTHDPMYACFYLTICYFIQLMEAAESEDVSEIVYKVKQFRGEVNKRSINAKSRARVKEWLHKDGIGFQRLRSGKQEKEEMLPLRGSVRFSSWQEARQYGEFPCISWRGLSIFFDPSTTEHRFEEDDKVEFTVGFNFRGPRVVHFTPVCMQSDGAGITKGNTVQQNYVHELSETQIGSHTYSSKKSHKHK